MRVVAVRAMVFCRVQKRLYVDTRCPADVECYNWAVKCASLHKKWSRMSREASTDWQAELAASKTLASAGKISSDIAGGFSASYHP